jgi:hypothetical protein
MREEDGSSAGIARLQRLQDLRVGGDGVGQEGGRVRKEKTRTRGETHVSNKAEKGFLCDR